MQKKITGAQVNILLDDIADVDLTTFGINIGDVLKWNGTNWIPQADLNDGITGIYVSDADSLDEGINTYGPTDNLFFPGTLITPGGIGGFEIRPYPLIIATTYNGTPVMEIPNTNASPSHFTQLVFGSGLTATVTGTWNESLLITATGGVAEPANQVVFGTGAATDSSPRFTFVESTGELTLNVGNTSTAPALVNIQAAAASTGSLAIGGSIQLRGGNGDAAQGGDVFLDGGTNGSSTSFGASGGHVYVYGGNDSEGGGGIEITSGSITAQAGQFAGVGSVYIGGGFITNADAASLFQIQPVVIAGGMSDSTNPSANGVVQIRTNDFDRMTVNADGAVSFDGSYGNPGEVLTSSGASLPPVWAVPPAPAARVQTYLFSMPSPAQFNGSSVTGWNISAVHNPPSPQFVDIDGTYTDRLITLEGGTYRITINASIGIAGETLILPDDLTAYGIEMVTSGGSYFGPNPSYHTNYSSSSSPGNMFSVQGYAGFPMTNAASNFTWSDQYVLQAATGAVFGPILYVYNYNNTITEFLCSMVVIVEKISNDAGA